MKRVLLINREGREELASVPDSDGKLSVVYTVDDTGKLRMFRYDYIRGAKGEKTYPQFVESVAVPLLGRSLPDGF